MKTILMTAILASAQFAVAQYTQYTYQAEFSTTSSQIQLVDAQYDIIPTQTVVQPIPGCNPTAEDSPDCNETIVIEGEAVIVANISFQDSMFSNEGNQMNYTSVRLPLSAFTAADVATLRAVYPRWKHPFSNAPRKFAKKNLALTIEKLEKGMMIVDMARSQVCRVVGETGRPPTGCVEKLVYKQVKSPFIMGTVILK